MSTFRIDYIRVRIDTLFENDVKQQIHALSLPASWVETKGMFSYGKGARDVVSGAKIFSEGEVSMRVLLELPGKALEQYASVSVFTREVLERKLLGLGVARRVDFAFDCANAFTVDELATAFDAGEATTPAHNILYIKSRKGGKGATLYVGSRTSERFTRAYDKGAEQGGAENEHVRVELETKGDVAALFGAMVANGVNARDLGASSIRKAIQWPKLNEACDGATVEIPAMPRLTGSTIVWLMEQVAPALRTLSKEPGFLEFFAEFRQAAGINDVILQETQP